MGFIVKEQQPQYLLIRTHVTTGIAFCGACCRSIRNCSKTIAQLRVELQAKAKQQVQCDDRKAADTAA